MENSQLKEAFDLDSLVDIVPTYKCRFCPFTTEAPETMRSHLMEHAVQIDKNKDLGNSAGRMQLLDASKACGGIKVEVNPIDSESAQLPLEEGENSSAEGLDSHIKAVLEQNDIKTVQNVGDAITPSDNSLPLESVSAVIEEENAASLPAHPETNEQMGVLNAPTLMATKELFLCGQCHTGFHSMEDCKTHIEQDHQMVVSAENLNETSVQGGFRNITNAMTQEEAMLLWQKGKKPPRKRKNKVDEEDVRYAEDLKKQLIEEDAFRVNFESTRGEGKRKVKPPKALFKEYFVGVGIDGEENVAESTTQTDPDDPDDPDYKYGKTKTSNEKTTVTPRKQRRLEEPEDDRDQSYVPSETEIEDAEAEEKEEGHETDVAEEVGPEPKATPKPAKISTKKKRKLFRTVKMQKAPRRKRKFKCSVPFCKAKFWSKDSYTLHCKCHDEEKSILKCYECGEKFKMWSQCLLHMWRTHQIDLDLYRCDICDFRADLACKIDVHKAIHSDVRAYICKICNRGFKQASQLINHEALHGEYNSATGYALGKKTCQLCEKTFATEKGLKDHMHLVHKRPKFQCTFCAHTTTSKVALESHIRIHTGDKPYHCDFCGFQCADHNTLRRHRMRHTGTKPYTCPHCSYSCIQSTSLKTHIKTKHGGVEVEGVYSCKLCGFNTVSEKRLKSHMMHHENGTGAYRANGKTTEIVTKGGVSLGKVIVTKPQTTKPRSNLLGASLSCTECGHATTSLAEMLSHLAKHSASSNNAVVSTIATTDKSNIPSAINVTSSEMVRTVTSNATPMVASVPSASQVVDIMSNPNDSNITTIEENGQTNLIVTETTTESVIAIPISLPNGTPQGIVLSRPPQSMNPCVIVDRFGNVISQEKTLQNNQNTASITILSDMSGQQNIAINSVLQPFSSTIQTRNDNAIEVISLPQCSGVPPLQDIFEVDKSEETEQTIELKPQQSASPISIVDTQTVDNIHKTDEMLEVSIETENLYDHMQTGEAGNPMEFIIHEPVEENANVQFEEIAQEPVLIDSESKPELQLIKCDISEEIHSDNEIIIPLSNETTHIITEDNQTVSEMKSESITSTNRTNTQAEHAQNSEDILPEHQSQVIEMVDCSSQPFSPLLISKEGRMETVNLTQLAEGGFVVTDTKGRPVQVSNLQIVTMQEDD